MPDEAPFQAARVRVGVVVAFVLVVLASVPVWWKTTQIVRLALPVTEVGAWEQQGVGVATYPGMPGPWHGASRAYAGGRRRAGGCV